MPRIRRNIMVRRSRAAGWARLVGGLALPVLVLGVLGVRVGLVPPVALEPVLVAGFALGVVALALAVYSLADIWVSGAEGAGSAFAAIVYASPVLVVLGLVVAAAILYPRVSDVTTDIDDPPRFVSSKAPHGIPDADMLARQESGYPDLGPRLYPLPIGDVFAAARRVVDSNGWAVTSEARPEILPTAASSEASSLVVPEGDDLTKALAGKTVMTQSRGDAKPEVAPVEGTGESAGTVDQAVGSLATIEAAASTPVFGFVDDVVIRMQVAEDGSTQVDMRSASRSGVHDLGENARRIKSFFTKLDAILQPEPGASGAGIASAGQ
jgi:uncharacterized protein (DUF1499 family)